MALFGSLGDWIQRALFTTTFKDVIESIDGISTRIRELEKKLDREVGILNKQLEELTGKENKESRDETQSEG